MTLLIDPWLSGDLVFFTPSFFKSSKKFVNDSTKRDVRNFNVDSVSAIVLTQGLPDHTHVPTLRKLPRGIPVIAPEDAVPIVKDLGFEQVIQLNPGDILPVPGHDNVTLTGAKGSIVGPPWAHPQLAILFSFTVFPTNVDESDASLRATYRIYHEPHGNHDVDFITKEERFDAVVVPIVSSKLPILGNYALVNGIEEAVQLCRLARPVTCVAFNNSAEEMSGFLSNFIESQGNLEVFKRSIARIEHSSNMRIIGGVGVMRDVIIAGDGVGDIVEETND